MENERLNLIAGKWGPATGGALLHGVAGFLEETVRVAQINGLPVVVSSARGDLVHAFNVPEKTKGFSS